MLNILHLDKNSIGYFFYNLSYSSNIKVKLNPKNTTIETLNSSLANPPKQYN